MQLNDYLYTVTASRTADGEATFTLALNAACPIYAAHFPGHPVTPGVCIVQTAKELLETVIGKPLDIVAVKNVKFLAVLSPDGAPQVECSVSKIQHAADGDEVSARVEMSCRGATVAKISLTCKPHDDRH